MFFNVLLPRPPRALAAGEACEHRTQFPQHTPQQTPATIPATTPAAPQAHIPCKNPTASAHPLEKSQPQAHIPCKNPTASAHPLQKSHRKRTSPAKIPPRASKTGGFRAKRPAGGRDKRTSPAKIPPSAHILCKNPTASAHPLQKSNRKAGPRNLRHTSSLVSRLRRLRPAGPRHLQHTSSLVSRLRRLRPAGPSHLRHTFSLVSRLRRFRPAGPGRAAYGKGVGNYLRFAIHFARPPGWPRIRRPGGARAPGRRAQRVRRTRRASEIT